MSRGLLARKQGDIFKSKTGNPDIIFNKVSYFPGLPCEEYNSASELKADLAQFENAVFENLQTPKTRAFIVSWFTCSLSNKQKCSVRFVSKLKPNPHEIFIENKVFNGEYSYYSNTTLKSQLLLSPTDFIVEPVTKDVLFEKAISQIKKIDANERFICWVSDLFKFPDKQSVIDKSETSISLGVFRDVFCECIHPYILANKQERIHFATSKNNPLWDSWLENSTIFVSSKGGKYGAESSILNLSGDIDFIDIIKSANQWTSPFLLLRHFQFIDDLTLNWCLGFNSKMGSIADHVGEIDNPFLRNLFLRRKCKNPEWVDRRLHLLAAVAHFVCDYINNTPEQLVKLQNTFQNKNILQVYTDITETKNTWQFNGFHIKQLNANDVRIEMSANKTYSSCQVKGNFTFRIR